MFERPLRDQAMEKLAAMFFANNARPSVLPPAFRPPEFLAEDNWDNPDLSQNCIWDYLELMLFQTYLAPYREGHSEVADWRLYHLDGVFYLEYPKGAARRVSTRLGHYGTADLELSRRTRKYISLLSRSWSGIMDSLRVAWSFSGPKSWADVSFMVPSTQSRIGVDPVHYRVTENFNSSRVEWDRVIMPPIESGTPFVSVPYYKITDVTSGTTWTRTPPTSE